MQLIILALALLISPPVWAQTYHVKPPASGGSDSFNCTQAQDPATPKATPAAAIACAGSSQGAGANKIVEVWAGTYTGFLQYLSTTTNFPSGTSWNAPFTLRAKSGDVVTLRGTSSGVFQVSSTYPLYAIVSGFVVDGVNTPTSGSGSVFTGACCGVNVSYFRLQNNILTNNNTNAFLGNGEHVEILSNTFISGTGIWGTGDTSCGQSACYGYPIYWGGSDSIIADNVMHGFPSWGIHLNGGGPYPSRNTVTRNKIYNYGFGDSRENAIVINNGDDNFVTYNRIYGSAAKGIGIGTNANNNKVYNNTVDTITGIGIEISNATTTTKNNIVTNITNSTKVSTVGTRSNNFGEASDTGIDIVGNPRFVDAANGDYRLCAGAGDPHANCGATPSAAIDVGVDVGLTSDAVGTTVPQGSGVDVGALEAGGATLPPTCPATPALVAQYGLDGSAADTSGNANHGSEGSGVSYATGRYGQAASFAGSGAITVANSVSLWVCTGFTVSAWIKPSNTPTDFVAVAVKNYRYFLYSSSSGFCAAGAPIGGYSQGGNAVVCHGTGFTAAVWSYFTVTYDGTNLRIWKDAVNVSTQAATAILDQTSGSLMIGGSQFGEFFQGQIDEVRIYNYARSGAQIATDMTTPINTLVAAAAIKFGTGTTLKLGPSTTLKLGIAQ